MVLYSGGFVNRNVAEWDVKLIGFATPEQAEEMQRWIAESGIETRPAPVKFGGPQLSVG